MSNESNTEFQNIGLLIFRVDQQQREIEKLKTDIVSLETHISQQEVQRGIQEKRQLVAGVSFLGSIVFLLVGVIWSYRTVIFRGTS